MNQNQGTGGSYTIGEDGNKTLVERTEDHPEGNRPRDAEETPSQPAARRNRKSTTEEGAK